MGGGGKLAIAAAKIPVDGDYFTAVVKRDAENLLPMAAGQRNRLFEEPPALHDLKLGIRSAVSAHALLASRPLVQSGPVDKDGYLWFDLPPLGYFEAIQVSCGRH